MDIRRFMNSFHRVGGLLFESPIPLATPAIIPNRDPDAIITIQSPKPISTELPQGKILCHVDFGSWVSTQVATHEGVLLRISGTIEALYTQPDQQIIITPDPSLSEGMLEVLLAASLLAPLFQLKGFSLLHASAVECGNSLVGIFGQSGAGKTTLATALCCSGMGLYADDMLPLLIEQERIYVNGACSTSLRLRNPSLACRFLDDPSSYPATGDGRLKYSPATARNIGKRAISGLIIPDFSGHNDRLELHRVSVTDALLALLANGKRSGGTRCKTRLQNDFNKLNILSQSTPLYRATLTKEHLDPAELAHKIEAQLKLEPNYEP
jgi:hypothetical protein